MRVLRRHTQFLVTIAILDTKYIVFDFIFYYIKGRLSQEWIIGAKKGRYIWNPHAESFQNNRSLFFCLGGYTEADPKNGLEKGLGVRYKIKILILSQNQVEPIIDFETDSK